MGSLYENIFKSTENQRIHILNLSNNRLNSQGLPDTVFEGQAFLELYLDYNYITDVKREWFEEMNDEKGTYLELDLSYNLIEFLPGKVFSGVSKSLSNLNLSNNKISTLNRHAFSGNPHLENLNLSNNRITTLPHGLFTGINFEFLDLINLRENRIQHVNHGAFSGNSMLNSVGLDGNFCQPKECNYSEIMFPEDYEFMYPTVIAPGYGVAQDCYCE